MLSAHMSNIKDTEVGMIQHCLSFRINRLVRFYIDDQKLSKEESYKKVAKVVEELYLASKPPQINKYTKNTDGLFLLPPVVAIVKYELYGIFHPDLRVLNMLNIFDPALSMLTEQAKQEIKEYSSKYIQHIFQQNFKIELVLQESKSISIPH